MSTTSFKRRSISPDEVAKAQDAALQSPIVQVPREQTVSPSDLGARQELAQQPAPQSQVYSNFSRISNIQVGSIADVPLDKIRSNPFNPRAIYTKSIVERMALSLQQHGQRTAAQGFVDGDSVVLIEGETRFRGARIAGLGTLRVEIRSRPHSDRALYEQARAVNVERNDQTPLDDALRWREFLDRGMYPTQAALAAAMEIKEDLVSRILSLASLPKTLLLVVSDYPELMSYRMLNALREFWEQAGDQDSIELIHHVAKEGLGYREVVARRKALSKEREPRPRSNKISVMFRGVRGEIKTFEKEGRVDFSLKGLSPSDANLLTDRIRDLLN